MREILFTLTTHRLLLGFVVNLSNSHVAVTMPGDRLSGVRRENREPPEGGEETDTGTVHPRDNGGEDRPRPKRLNTLA